MKRLSLILASAAMISAPAVANAQNPLSSIFECQNPNNRQGTGAVVGGLLGGVLGSAVAGDDDETLGAVLGAAVGAAAGSYIGCRTNAATADRAEVATRQALDQGRSTTWSNASTGVSGRVDIVDTYYRPAPGYSQPSYQTGGNYTSTADVRNISYARGVAFPQNYQDLHARYRADSRTNLRAGPSTNAGVLDQLSAGERFEAIARVDGNWLLVARNGVAVGYVAEWVVNYETQLATAPGGYQQQPNYNNQQNAQQVCRTFDQTVRYGPNAAPTTNRYTACQVASGDWMLEGQA